VLAQAQEQAQKAGVSPEVVAQKQNTVSDPRLLPAFNLHATGVCVLMYVVARSVLCRVRVQGTSADNSELS
jgi:hypothetical protein